MRKRIGTRPAVCRKDNMIEEIWSRGCVVKSWQQEFRKIETVNLRHCDRGRLTHVKAECLNRDRVDGP